MLQPFVERLLTGALIIFICEHVFRTFNIAPGRFRRGLDIAVVIVVLLWILFGGYAQSYFA